MADLTLRARRSVWRGNCCFSRTMGIGRTVACAATLLIWGGCGSHPLSPIGDGSADSLSMTIADATPRSCVDLDPCACLTSPGCAPVAQACWCPFPQCDQNAACVCGGGQFISCAPAATATCDGAKARVSTLCPTIAGPTFDGLCRWSAPECVTKCLNEVSSCGDVGCSFCEACDCQGDPFNTCYQHCAATFGG